MSQPSLDPRLVADLRSTISGTVAYRGDRVFDRLLAGHNLAVRHHPDVVVEAASSTDVAAAVRVAVDHGLPVTVHATGHGAPHGVEDGVVVSTRRLDSVSIDADALTATVGAGAVWGAVVAAAETHGLVPVSTNGPSVGVVGSVLGGGIGPLSRAHGFAAQHVRRLTVVTADGFERTVTPEEDLGWALLGGRDGIGVVTSVVLDLLPAPALWGGEAVFVEDLGGVLDEWRERADAASEATSTTASVARLPDVDDVPPPMRGRDVVRVVVASTDPQEAEALVSALQRVKSPVDSRFGPLTLGEWLTRHGDDTPPMPTWQRGVLLADLTGEALDVVLGAVAGGAPFLGVEVRRLSGALSSRTGDAVGGRDAAWLVNVLGVPDPALFDDVVPGAVDLLEAALEPWTTGGSQLNFHGRPSAARPTRLAWPPDVSRRLDRIRREIDPRQVFGRAGSVLSS